MTPREDDFHRVGHEKYSHFQFNFLKSLTPREAYLHLVGLEKKSDFPLCWTWKFFDFSLTPREADFYRVGLEKFSDFRVSIFDIVSDVDGWTFTTGLLPLSSLAVAEFALTILPEILKLPKFLWILSFPSAFFEFSANFLQIPCLWICYSNCFGFSYLAKGFADFTQCWGVGIGGFFGFWC